MATCATGGAIGCRRGNRQIIQREHSSAVGPPRHPPSDGLAWLGLSVTSVSAGFVRKATRRVAWVSAEASVPRHQLDDYLRRNRRRLADEAHSVCLPTFPRAVPMLAAVAVLAGCGGSSQHKAHVVTFRNSRRVPGRDDRRRVQRAELRAGRGDDEDPPPSTSTAPAGFRRLTCTSTTSALGTRTSMLTAVPPENGDALVSKLTQRQRNFLLPQPFEQSRHGVQRRAEGALKRSITSRFLVGHERARLPQYSGMSLDVTRQRSA